MSKIKSETLVSRFGDAMLDNGFTSIPNTILFYKNRLGITAKELHLIIMVMALNGRGIDEIKDKALNPDGKSFSRQRKSLTEKGLLKYEVVKCFKKGQFVTLGVLYDFSLLKDKVTELVEYDNKVMESEAPVEAIELEPALPGFDEFENRPVEIPHANNKKLETYNNIKNQKEISNITNEESDFLRAFQKLHFKCLNESIDFNKRKKYLGYLLRGFEKKKNNFNVAIEMAKQMFMNIKPSQRTSLKLQDVVCNALIKIDDKKINNNSIDDAYKIPSGIDVLDNLLNKIKTGTSIKEAYKNAITN